MLRYRRNWTLCRERGGTCGGTPVRGGEEGRRRRRRGDTLCSRWIHVGLYELDTAAKAALSSSLLRAWVARKQLLDQCLDLQMFNREAEAAESWVAKREAFLATEELGDSLDAVEALIKKHEDMDKSLQAQVNLYCITGCPHELAPPPPPDLDACV